MPLKGGARKAYRAMTKRYGTTRGRAIFYAKANKSSRKGKTMHARTRGFYRKGGKQK